MYSREHRGGPSAGDNPMVEIYQGPFRSLSQTASRTASATDLWSHLSVNCDGTGSNFPPHNCLHGDKERLIEGTDKGNSPRNVRGHVPVRVLRKILSFSYALKRMSMSPAFDALQDGPSGPKASETEVGPLLPF